MIMNVGLHSYRYVQGKTQAPAIAPLTSNYTRQTGDQKRFTILEVTANWHQLMIPQPSIACVSEQLDTRHRPITAPVSHRHSPSRMQ